MSNLSPVSPQLCVGVDKVPPRSGCLQPFPMLGSGLDSYTIRSENLSLTLEKKWCHAELGSASCFCPEGEILKQVQDDKPQNFQISLVSLIIYLFVCLQRFFCAGRAI
jgi:hypothetical protein